MGIIVDHFCPKQLVSVSHATPDLIPGHEWIHLSVPSPKPQIAMHMPRKWKLVKKKCLQMNQKQGRTLQNIKTNHFRQLFNQQKSSRSLPTKKKKKKKSQIFVIFRVWKSTFQYFLRFFKNYWDFQTLLERIRKWLGNIKALNNWSQSPPEELI